VFSLLRESDLIPRLISKAFFDTGYERESEYNAEPGAPNRGLVRQRPIRAPRGAAIGDLIVRFWRY
jgi:hypothetical protein